MPDETHRFLIQYETTATRAAAEMDQVTRTLQEQVAWAKTATDAFETFSTQSQASMTQWATNVTQTIEYVQHAWRGYMQELAGRVRGFEGVIIPRGLGGIEALMTGDLPARMPGISQRRLEEFMQRQYGGFTQRWRETQGMPEWTQAPPPARATWQSLWGTERQGLMPGYAEEALTAARPPGGIMDAERLRDLSTFMRDFNEEIGTFTGSREGVEQGFRALKEGLDDTGESAQKSGHWLGNYIQRYLIRYFVVWQGMVALKAGIRDWIQAHEDMARAIFRVQGAMQATTSEARQYMGTLAGIGAGIGVPAGQMVGGAIQTGQPQLVGQMAQWGQVTGAGAQQAIALFTQTQRDYNLTAEETTMIMARLFVAWDKLGIPIQEITSDLGKWLGKVGEAPELIGYMNQRFVEFGEQGLNVTDKLSAAWDRYLSKLGSTGPILAAKTALADMFNVATERMEFMERSMEERQALMQQYYAETGVRPSLRQLPEQFLRWVEEQEPAAVAQGPTTTAHEQWRLTGISPTEQAGGIGTRLIDSVQIMTQAQFDQLDRLTQQHEESLTAQGIRSKELTQQIAISTEQGYIFQSIDTNILAMLLATEDMRDMQRRQMTGVWNFPAGAAVMLTTPQALGQVELQGPTPPPYTSAIGGELYIPGASPYGVEDYMYQEGGPVTETGPAIVHKGEYVFTQDQTRRLSLPESLPMLERLIGRQPMATEPRRGRLDDEPLVEPRRIEQDWPTQFVPMQPADNLQETIMGLMQTFNVPQYQYGGVVPGPVGQPQPAIVEGGESITPRGQAAMGSIKLHSHLYLNSREISSDIAKIQGDKLLQAQRASVGATGSLISI